MEKLKLGLQNAELSIELLSKVFFYLWYYMRRMPAGVQSGADGMPDHQKRETDRERYKHLPLAVFSVHGGRSGL